jgi:hypothetical protein
VVWLPILDLRTQPEKREQNRFMARREAMKKFRAIPGFMA